MYFILMCIQGQLRSYCQERWIELDDLFPFKHCNIASFRFNITLVNSFTSLHSDVINHGSKTNLNSRTYKLFAFKSFMGFNTLLWVLIVQKSLNHWWQNWPKISSQEIALREPWTNKFPDDYDSCWAEKLWMKIGFPLQDTIASPVACFHSQGTLFLSSPFLLILKKPSLQKPCIT